MKQKLTSMVAAIALPLFTTAPALAEDTITLMVGTIQSPADLVYKGYEAAVEYINENGDGSLEVNLFHSGQLGGQDTMSQDVNQGQYDIGQSSAAIMASFYEPIGILSAPYIFRDADHLMAVMNGDIGQELYGKVEENSNIKVLSTWYYGTRHLTSNVLGTSPAELENVKMRIYNAPIAYEFAAALGTRATPIDFNELYLALKTGVVDAQENPLPVIFGRKFYEVQDHLILTGHVVEPYMIIINQDKWDSLPADLQELVSDGFNYGGEVFFQMMKEQESGLVAELEQLGMQVTRPADMQPFYSNADAIFERRSETWDPVVAQRIRSVQ